MLCVTSRDRRNSATTESSRQREGAPVCGEAGSSTAHAVGATPKFCDFSSALIQASRIGDRLPRLIDVIERDRRAIGLRNRPNVSANDAESKREALILTSRDGARSNHIFNSMDLIKLY
jgi:hypothetical protein